MGVLTMHHGWLLGLLGVVFLSACAKEQAKQSGWSGFPVAIYSDAAVVATTQDKTDLFAAFTYWEAKAGRQLFDYKGEWTGSAPYTGSASAPTDILANVIFFQNPWPFSAQTAGQTTVISSQRGIHGSIIMLNENIGRCSGNCSGETQRISQQKLIAHELGHFLGLEHSSASGDIMYPSISPGGTLSSTGANTSALQAVVNK